MTQLGVAPLEAVFDLQARLPEIAWRLRAVDSLWRHLPPGLFTCTTHEQTCTAEQCIKEITSNLNTLHHTTNARVAHFLAQQIQTKIEVLLKLSQLPVASQRSTSSQRYTIDSLLTRQHYLAQLHSDIRRLSAQQTALETTLASQLAQGLRDESVARLQRDLGELARYLTQAQEALAVATGSQWRND